MALPRMDRWEERLPSTTIQVLEKSAEPRWTGLYDHSGLELYAVEEMDPIGFLRFP